MGIPREFQRFIKRLAGRRDRPGESTEMRCRTCHVPGHTVKTCMFSSDREVSTSQHAARDFIRSDKTIAEVAKEHGLSREGVHRGLFGHDHARLGTLRAMNEILADDIFNGP